MAKRHQTKIDDAEVELSEGEFTTDDGKTLKFCNVNLLIRGDSLKCKVAPEVRDSVPEDGTTGSFLIETEFKSDRPPKFFWRPQKKAA